MPCWCAVPTTSPEDRPAAGEQWPVWLHSPDSVWAVATVRSARTGVESQSVMWRDGPRWCAEVDADDGDLYWFVIDGVGPLVDPRARDVVMTDGGPRGVVRRSWPQRSRGASRRARPVVYEVHVRGFARTLDGLRERLPYLADLGVDVIELMPVHPFDTSHNYWGYMPIVWGAVHRPFAAGPDAAAELADLVAAAHDVGIHVWLDVVFNHTGEGDATMPTWTLRGIDDGHAYRRDPDGSYNDDAGCGNVVDVADEEIRRLVLEALQRYTDLGVDGFRFDLASLLTRDGGALVRMIGDWGERLGVTLVAEAWDMAAYQVGAAFPDQRWMQWNDRFRDDVRGFLRGEPGLVPEVMRRIAGSPDLFGEGDGRSVDFVTAHDGLTLHDLTTVTSDWHRSWDCGPELRLQQMENAFCFLLLSVGTTMFVMGDEFARTQQGCGNPYDIDSELTWVDWNRLQDWPPLHDHVRRLITLRREHVGERPRFHGAQGDPDIGHDSRTLAWATGGLYVMANMWWNDLRFAVREHGPWAVELSTAPVPTELTVDRGAVVVRVPARSVVILRRA